MIVPGITIQAMVCRVIREDHPTHAPALLRLLPRSVVLPARGGPPTLLLQVEFFAMDRDVLARLVDDELQVRELIVGLRVIHHLAPGLHGTDGEEHAQDGAEASAAEVAQPGVLRGVRGVLAEVQQRESAGEDGGEHQSNQAEGLHAHPLTRREHQIIGGRFGVLLVDPERVVGHVVGTKHLHCCPLEGCEVRVNPQRCKHLRIAGPYYHKRNELSSISGFLLLHKLQSLHAYTYKRSPKPH